MFIINNTHKQWTKWRHERFRRFTKLHILTLISLFCLECSFVLYLFYLQNTVACKHGQLWSVAYGCWSGSKSQNRQLMMWTRAIKGSRIQGCHIMPCQDKDLCDKWVQAICREDFVATKYVKLCLVHFRESDFVKVSRDTNKQRRKSYDEQLRWWYLRDSAVSLIFPHAPQ
jgi:hypothetical protein